MKDNIDTSLKFLGLTTEQIKVYFAALDCSESTIQDLSNNSGVKRTSIYNFIDELVKGHFITVIQKKRRKHYSAVHPSHLLEIMKFRLKEVEHIIPKLVERHNISNRGPRVMIYDGVEGIKEVLIDILKEKTPVVAWSDFKHMSAILGEYYFDVFPPERAKRGIASRNIVPDSPQARKLSMKDDLYLRKSKFLPLPDFKTEINIYGNKVALNSYKSNPPFAVIIEDKNLADTLKTIWKAQWDKI